MSVPSHRPARRRALAVAGAVLAAVVVPVAVAGPASAHVRVDPGGDGTVTAGAYALLTFRVPNESATASTTTVTVDLPAETPFTSVSVEPVPGWTATVTTAPLADPVEVHGTTLTEAPASITWTADDEDAAIHDGELRRFVVSAGRVPDVEQLVLPATQTYSDGTVVAWDEVPANDGDDVEHPAPVLTVVAPAADEAAAETAEASGTEAGDGGDTAGTAGADRTPSTAWATGLGAAGLGLGLVGAATGVVALSRSGRRADGDGR